MVTVLCNMSMNIRLYRNHTLRLSDPNLIICFSVRRNHQTKMRNRVWRRKTFQGALRSSSRRLGKDLLRQAKVKMKNRKNKSQRKMTTMTITQTRSKMKRQTKKKKKALEVNGHPFGKAAV